MVPVPTMGDSITEGTVNEFKKSKFKEELYLLFIMITEE